MNSQKISRILNLIGILPTLIIQQFILFGWGWGIAHVYRSYVHVITNSTMLFWT